MTVFVYTWNATFLATPADIEDEALGAQRIRDTKAAVGERLAVDHSLYGDANDGKHLWATLRDNGSTTAAALDSGDGRLFAADVGGNTELYYQDSNGRVVQLTSNGSVGPPAGAPVIPSGTNMLFVQAAVPPGWTLRTDLNDQLIRVNGTSGGGTGGSWTISGVTTAGHTLVLAEMPSHDHGIASYLLMATNAPSLIGYVGSGNDVGTVQPSYQGSNIAHDHGAVVSDGTWRPAYVDAVVGTKT